MHTLSRTSAPAGSPVRSYPLRFDASLEEALDGVDVLYNTYWIRFECGDETFGRAVDNTRSLLAAAAGADVRRVVHVGVTRASPESPFPYFRGKAAVEDAVRASGLSCAIVRPTWIFGPGDILVNNVAWLLRRFPVFLLPSGSGYEVQPVSVEDVARLCVDAGARTDDEQFDAAGPDRLTFPGVVRLLHRAVRSRARLVAAPPWTILALARAFDLGARDVLLTREELAGLRDGLLTSDEAPRGERSLSDWVERHADELGRSYVSELARNFRGYAPV